MDAKQLAEQLIMSERGMNAIRHCDACALETMIADVIEKAVEAERRKGYGPGFSALVAGAEPLAASIVDAVRVNTPDLTGLGMVQIAANNIAAFAATEVAAAVERCAKLAEDAECSLYGVHEACDVPDAIRAGIAKAIREVAPPVQSPVSLVRDLWRYATGEEWGELDEDRCAASGDTLAGLHRRVAALLAGGPTWTAVAPTVAGLYWFRGAEFAPAVWRVYVPTGSKRLYMHHGDADEPLGAFPGEWWPVALEVPT